MVSNMDEITCNHVYCQWVNFVVDEKDLPSACKEFITDGKCLHCEISPQVALGMGADELLRNIRG
jgi:hypothetical protein